MAKVIDVNGVPHRMRRGKLVPIPPEWFRNVTHKQTIRKRQSKQGKYPRGSDHPEVKREREGDARTVQYIEPEDE